MFGSIVFNLWKAFSSLRIYKGQQTGFQNSFQKQVWLVWQVPMIKAYGS